LDQHPALSREGGSVEVEESRLQVRDASIVSPWFQAYRSVLDFVEACLTMLGSQKIGGDRETACIERVSRQSARQYPFLMPAELVHLLKKLD
jgi:hypothetical protein